MKTPLYKIGEIVIIGISQKVADFETEALNVQAKIVDATFLDEVDEWNYVCKTGLKKFELAEFNIITKL